MVNSSLGPLAPSSFNESMNTTAPLPMATEIATLAQETESSDMMEDPEGLVSDECFVRIQAFTECLNDQDGTLEDTCSACENENSEFKSECTEEELRSKGTTLALASKCIPIEDSWCPEMKRDDAFNCDSCGIELVKIAGSRWVTQFGDKAEQCFIENSSGSTITFTIGVVLLALK